MGELSHRGMGGNSGPNVKMFSFEITSSNYSCYKITRSFTDADVGFTPKFVYAMCVATTENVSNGILGFTKKESESYPRILCVSGGNAVAVSGSAYQVTVNFVNNGFSIRSDYSTSDINMLDLGTWQVIVSDEELDLI